MARFFIDRPVFAWVISLLIVLAGVLAIRFLPVAQYPDIAPPVVNVSASYPGASAKVVEEAVTAIIEREMNGAPGLLYTKATSSTGQASLTLTFRQGVNADLAAVEVQNRLKIVESRLPESVRRDGIYVEKAADSIQLIVTLTSSSGRYDAMELGEIASSNVLQALRRVEGVGKVETWGAEYAMRIWPDPAKLTSMNLSASDLVNAVRRHNARLTVGDIGNLGVPDSAPISATVKVDDTLVTPEQFGEIPLAHPRRRRRDPPARRGPRRVRPERVRLRLAGQPDDRHRPGGEDGARLQRGGHRQAHPRHPRRAVALLPGGRELQHPL